MLFIEFHFQCGLIALHFIVATVSAFVGWFWPFAGVARWMNCLWFDWWHCHGSLGLTKFSVVWCCCFTVKYRKWMRMFVELINVYGCCGCFWWLWSRIEHYMAVAFVVVDRVDLVALVAVDWTGDLVSRHSFVAVADNRFDFPDCVHLANI